MCAVKVIRGDELAAQGFGGLYGVGKAAVEPPALVVLSYLPDGAAAGAGAGAGGSATQTAAAASGVGGRGSVCFVGKGIIYDTGGLSIKTKTGMVRGHANEQLWIGLVTPLGSLVPRRRFQVVHKAALACEKTLLESHCCCCALRRFRAGREQSARGFSLCTFYLIFAQGRDSKQSTTI